MGLPNITIHYFSFVSQMITLMIVSCTIFIPIFALVVLFLKYWVHHHSKNLLPHLKKGNSGRSITVIGFFHPYCNDGGGGERVLWTAIKAIQMRYPDVKCLVYSGDVDVSCADILYRVEQRFNIVIPENVEFVFLKRRKWVEANNYPIFTLLGQSLGSIIFGWEALLSYVPDIYIDTMGYAFTIPLFRYFGGCKVASYVHYPTISTDMLGKVSQRTLSHNNAGFISRSLLFSTIKIWYYKVFAYMYGFAGKRCDVIMVNSSWTYGHIRQLWQAPERTTILYPPCDVSEFVKIPLKSKIKEALTIISVAQFRPEKDHPLQIKAFHHFLQTISIEEREDYKLLLVGSVRNMGDSRLVDRLKHLCEKLMISEYVEFKLNVTFEELKHLLSSSLIGLHTMWNEHFGIGVVECMAAGAVILAHNSGGPKMDIVIPFEDKPTGFLADSVETYAYAMKKIFSMSQEERLFIRRNARESVARFSEKSFEHKFISTIEQLMKVAKWIGITINRDVFMEDTWSDKQSIHVAALIEIKQSLNQPDAMLPSNRISV